MQGAKQNCWEHMKCGKEGACPAYPDYGRICWSKSGTFCGGEIQLGFSEKKDNCKRCRFYDTLDTKFD